MALAADLGGATTTVAADGTWSLDVTTGLTAGTHEVQLTQALGARAIAPQTVTFSIAAAPTVPAPLPSGAPSPSPTGGAAAGTGSPSGSLAATGGSDAGVWPFALAGAVLVAVGGSVLAVRRSRRTSSAES